MDKFEGNSLEDLEVVGLIVGFMVGINVLNLPSQMAIQIKQSAWISVIIGGIYPLTFGFILIYCCKKHPDDSILVLSERYFGYVFGTICNILFMLNFVFYIVITAASFTNVLRVYATDFLEPIKILISIIFIGAYIAYNNIKVIGRINKIALYLLVVLILMLSFAFVRGRYLNMFPIFSDNLFNLVKSSKESIYAYAGMEALFVIYPFIKNKDKVSSIVLKGVIITILTYAFVTLITIYYLGYKCTTKLLWPVIMVTESINLSFINSFRLAFLLLWSIIAIKLLVNQFFVLNYIVQYTLKIKNIKKVYVILYPVLIIFSLKFTQNEIKMREFLHEVGLKVIVFNMIYIVSVFIIIFLKSITKKTKTDN